jgi:hypothetical protein
MALIVEDNLGLATKTSEDHITSSPFSTDELALITDIDNPAYRRSIGNWSRTLVHKYGSVLDEEFTREYARTITDTGLAVNHALQMLTKPCILNDYEPDLAANLAQGFTDMYMGLPVSDEQFWQPLFDLITSNDSIAHGPSRRVEDSSIITRVLPIMEKLHYPAAVSRVTLGLGNPVYFDPNKYDLLGERLQGRSIVLISEPGPNLLIAARSANMLQANAIRAQIAHFVVDHSTGLLHSSDSLLKSFYKSARAVHLYMEDNLGTSNQDVLHRAFMRNILGANIRTTSQLPTGDVTHHI